MSRSAIHPDVEQQDTLVGELEEEEGLEGSTGPREGESRWRGELDDT